MRQEKMRLNEKETLFKRIFETDTELYSNAGHKKLYFIEDNDFNIIFQTYNEKEIKQYYKCDFRKFKREGIK